MILGDAPQHQVFRELPIGLAKLPETSAKGVHAGGGHVDRAETAMRGIVDGAELLRPPGGQRLRLVATGEECQFIGIAAADVAKPLRRKCQGLVPLDFAELAGTALTRAQQRLAQSRGRIMLLDPGRTLGADHAAIDRVLRIAIDVADAAVLQVHADAATACAHVTRRRLDLVSSRRVQVEGSVRHRSSRHRQERRMVNA